ncbi:MAG: hypothetical protein IKR48_09785 [Kiritimatiellae bacterium]|nr:hypothetical protein [Kiritimatiellia bacterium]
MRPNEILDLFRKAFETGRSAQSYLITGSIREMGSKLAVQMSQVLYCQSPNKPCGKCEACRKVEERLNVDVHWIFPEKKSRIISVKQMREQVLAPLSETSFAGGWKVCILVGADCLKEEAANAFLKTLEEPTARTLFILLSDSPQRLLPTIVSRCQRIDLEETRELVEPFQSRVLDVLASPYLRNSVERMAMSGQFVSILADMKAKAEEWVKEEESKLEKDGEVLEEKDVHLARVSARYRELRKDLVSTMSRWYRDLMVLVVGGDESLVYNQKQLVVLRERASRLKLHHALYNLKAIEELDRQLEMNLKEEHVFAYALDRIRHGLPTANG